MRHNGERDIVVLCRWQYASINFSLVNNEELRGIHLALMDISKHVSIVINVVVVVVKHLVELVENEMVAHGSIENDESVGATESVVRQEIVMGNREKVGSLVLTLTEAMRTLTEESITSSAELELVRVGPAVVLE